MKRTYSLDYNLHSDAEAQLARAIIFKHGGIASDVVFIGVYKGREIHSVKSLFIFGLNLVLAKLDIQERFNLS